MGLNPQEFLVNDLRVIAAPVDEDMVVGILDFQMSSGGYPGAIIFIHHEAANASIVEALFPQQWTHHEGVNNNMMFWTEMDKTFGVVAGLSGMTHPTIREPVSSSILNNIAVPRSHSRRPRGLRDAPPLNVRFCDP